MSLAFHKAFPNGVNLNTMTNDLKNFLEEETQNITQYAYFVDHQSEEELAEVVREHNTRLINFVLDLVEKEVEKLHVVLDDSDGQSNVEKMLFKEDISTIINNLRV